MGKNLHVTFISVDLTFHNKTWDMNFYSFFKNFPIVALRLGLIILLIKVCSVMWTQNINLVKGAWRYPSILTSDNVILSYLKIFKINPVDWDNNVLLKWWQIFCMGKGSGKKYPVHHVDFAVKGIRFCWVTTYVVCSQVEDDIYILIAKKSTRSYLLRANSFKSRKSKTSCTNPT